MATIGSGLTFEVEFTNDAGAAADPTTITFYLREHIDGTELTWIYNASPVEGTHYPTGFDAMVRDSLGNFHVDWTARKAERHIGFWLGAGAVSQTAQSTVFVSHTEIELVE